MSLPLKPTIDAVGHHYAGVILITESGRVIGQQRDDKPDIDNPAKISPFGGLVEGSESFLEAAYRELVEEETNLALQPEDFTLFWESVEWRPRTSEWEAYHIFTVTITDAALDALEVYEGQGWAEITSAEEPKLADQYRPIYAKVFTTLT